MRVELFTSSFCEPCIVTRGVIAEAARLVPGAEIVERDVAMHPDAAEAAGIRATPTVVVLGADNREVFRAEGVPTLNQVLVAMAKAV